MISYKNIETKQSINKKVKLWIKDIIANENKTCGDILIIFCSDEYLLKKNIKYLKHNNYTDVITFDYCIDNILSGDIFISTERVAENAIQYSVSYEHELYRVIAHAILHLAGYNDKSLNEKKIIKERENHYLKFITI